MRTLGKIAATLGVVGAIVAGFQPQLGTAIIIIVTTIVTMGTTIHTVTTDTGATIIRIAMGTTTHIAVSMDTTRTIVASGVITNRRLKSAVG